VKRVTAVVLSTVFAHVAMAQPSDWKKASANTAWGEPSIAGSRDPAIDTPHFPKLSATRAGFGSGRFNETVSKARLEGAAESLLQTSRNP
jgi:hypothetical protein